MIRNQDSIGYKKVGHHHGPTKDNLEFSKIVMQKHNNNFKTNV